MASVGAAKNIIGTVRSLAALSPGLGAAEILDVVLADPHAIERAHVAKEAGRYTRALLFGDWGTSVWLMRWMPGSRTPIHDHHCDCSYAILSGRLTDLTFRRCDESHVVDAGTSVRGAGSIAHLQPEGSNIHQMINETDEEAMSVHVYRFDPLERPNSIDRVYRRLI